MNISQNDGSTAFYFESLAAYIRENHNPEFDAANDRLIDLLDSVSLLQLILHIEEEFKIFLDPSSLSLEVFVDLSSLSAALQEHSAAT